MKYSIKWTVCLLTMLIAFANTEGQLPVARLGVEQGLSNETIRSIYQDKQGFLWFGTLDGLNRYDGYGFKVYRNQIGDTASLVGNVVLGITEDKGGNLWLATRQGACRLNMLTGNFTTLSFTDPKTGKTQRLEGEVIKSINCDSQNNILIASELRGLMLCPAASIHARLLPFVDHGKKLYQYGVQAIAFSSGNTLVFVQGKGLCRLNYKQQQLELLNGDVQYVNTMAPAGDSVWLAGNQGVFVYTTATGSVRPVLSVANGKLNSDLAMALAMDTGGKLWVATMGGGINRYDTHNNTMHYIEGGDGRDDLSSKGIYAVYIDRSDRVWIGTQRAGINMLDRRREKFVTYSHEPGNPGSLSGNFISSVCELADSTLVVATEGSGLNVQNRETRQFQHYFFNPGNPRSLASNNVNYVFQDHLGLVWVATYTDGICRFNRADNSFKRYKTVNQATGVENKVFNIFYEDHTKTLWATALRQGNFFGALYRYNRQQDEFELFDDKLSDIFVLKEDSQGNLWGGSITTLVSIDRVNRHHRSFDIGRFVRTISDGGNGRLWLGTEGGGLLLFDTRQGKIVDRYTTANGLSNNSIFSMLPDDAGNLWLGTFNGLSRFNTRSKTFTNFYRSDGLESDQFHFNAATRLHSGAFAFGGIMGYNVFNPNSLSTAFGRSPLHFTAIAVDGKPVQQEPAFIRDSKNSQVTAIDVPYAKGVFSFDFAALEYSVPDKISYAYYMEGWDKGWNYSGKNRSATYTRLEEGRYTFRVKCTDGNGAWSDEIVLGITVRPPWFRSWWAYLLYSAAIIGLLSLYLRYRARQARLEYEVSLEKVNVQREKAEREKQEAELAMEKAEHERHAAELEKERTYRAMEHAERDAEKAMADKEREENERRSAFFTNISHEFRTPLTLIINPVKDMLGKTEASGSHENEELETVYRNARRMLSLTNQLLLFRKAESGLDALHKTPFDLVALCREVYLCFSQQAKTKNIDYSFKSSQPAIPVSADREKLEIIFYNLLSNAMKYTPAGGTVGLSIAPGADQVDIRVTDSGPGIAPEAAEKIFNRFYQGKDTGRHIKAGFGIGLYLAKQFVTAHGGHISFADQPAGGTAFSVHLPIIAQQAIVEETLSDGEETGASLLHELAVKEEAGNTAENPYENAALDTGKLVASDQQSVLVIDDDNALRQYLVQVFREHYQVYEASDGEGGIAMAKKILPDIIISDIMMGDVSGIDLCQFIKTDLTLRHIPVILLTGTSSEELRLRGVKEGADDYLTKPFSKELLVARVSNLLKNRNSLQQYFYNEITLSKQDARISEQYREFLENCIQIVEEHLDDDAFNIKALASQMGMSYSSVTKKIKAISGQSLNGFVRFIRLRKAARLFIDTTYNVNEVAAMVGIFDARYFREQFHKLFGMNPSEYIKKYRQPFANKFTVNKDALEKGS